jgi:hypothetical protein
MVVNMELYAVIFINWVVQRNPTCHINPTQTTGKHCQFVKIMITPEPNDFASKKKRPTGICRVAVKEENR